jgi:calcineurin-like phosphoesterase family protein
MMDQQLIDNINNTVQQKDTLYILGDLTMGDATNAANAILRIACENIFIIPGGHDKRWMKHWHTVSEKAQRKIEILPQIHYMKWNKQWYVLCHYPMYSWERSHHGSNNLHGHSHGNAGHWSNSAEGHGATDFGIRLDVGVDVWDYFPISMEQVEGAVSYAKLKISNKKDKLFGGPNQFHPGRSVQ